MLYVHWTLFVALIHTPYFILHHTSVCSSGSPFYVSYIAYCIYVHKIRISVSLLAACCFVFFSFDRGPYVDFVIHSTMTFDTDWTSFYTLILINIRETVLYRFNGLFSLFFLRLLIFIFIGNTEQKTVMTGLNAMEGIRERFRFSAFGHWSSRPMEPVK